MGTAPSAKKHSMSTTVEKNLLAPYERPDARRASWQLVNSMGLYLGLWVAMVWVYPISVWLTLPLVLFAGAILVRVFIIFHDCSHGSFFASRRANGFWGRVTGLLTFTAYDSWRGEHAIHHGTTGNLDRRGIGDVWTMTVREYQEAGRWRRLGYRASRHPAFLLVLAPLLVFVVDNRIPKRSGTARARRSVWWTSAAILAWGTGLTFVFGLLPYIALQTAILAIAGAVGVWQFYTQHQFEHAYWRHTEDWSYEAAALRGSAYLRMPRILQWFTGNIGYHHIHHLSAKVPNYKLQACHESHPDLRGVPPMTLFESLRTFGLKLWDETDERLVCFRHLTRNRDPASA